MLAHHKFKMSWGRTGLRMIIIGNEVLIKRGCFVVGYALLWSTAIYAEERLYSSIFLVRLMESPLQRSKHDFRTTSPTKKQVPSLTRKHNLTRHHNLIIHHPKLLLPSPCYLLSTDTDLRGRCQKIQLQVIIHRITRESIESLWRL